MELELSSLTIVFSSSPFISPHLHSRLVFIEPLLDHYAQTTFDQSHCQIRLFQNYFADIHHLLPSFRHLQNSLDLDFSKNRPIPLIFSCS